MLHAAIVSAALTAVPPSKTRPQTAVRECFATMDGAVYHGDPSDRNRMRANAATCVKGIDEINAVRPAAAAQGPEKLFIVARVLDRAATLSFMGLGDSATALREVKTANLYFRIAAGLGNEPADYHEAALANVTLTALQLQTLHTERPLPGQPRHTARAVTAYHRL